MTNEKEKRELSIVMAVDEALLDARAFFHALSNQTMSADAYEVLIVDSSHTTTHQVDFEKNAEHLNENISYHRTGKGGRARALNYGLDHAVGNVIVFLGDDCQVPPNFVETHLRFHQTHPAIEAVAIGATIFPADLQTPFTEWLEKSGRLWGVPFDPDMTAIADHFFYAANASVKRELVDRAGRFDERFEDYAWDDLEYGERLRAAGMKSEFLPGAAVLHMHRIDLPGREAAMRLAGAAARTYLEIRPGTYPWLNSVNSTSLMHSLRLGRAYLRRLLARSNKAEQYWWINRLDAAFAEGYRHSERFLS